MDNKKIQLIECPRDAMQGLHTFIETQDKVDYINKLLKVGFHSIDFGSFVSPKAIPQLRDTAKVLEKLDLSKTKSKLLAIVANERGAQDATKFSEIDYLGYPFSISETFQLRNTNATIEQSLNRVEAIQSICVNHGKTMVIYISMGFGNPYGDVYNADIAAKWSEKLANELGVKIISLADTIGVSKPDSISELFNTLIPSFTNVNFGAHLHSNPNSWKEKIDSAFKAGCLRFDSAIKGYGGCPMADDELVGNMATENVVAYLSEQKVAAGLCMDDFNESMLMALNIFPL